MIMFALGWICGISLLLLGQYLNEKLQEIQRKHSPSHIFYYSPEELAKAFNDGVKESIANNEIKC